MKSENKLIKFLNGKGFYAVMGVCLLAIGITAWSVLGSMPKAPSILENSSSEIVTSEEQSSETPSEQPVAGEVSGVKADSSKQESEAPAESSTEKVTADYFTLPLTGEIIKQYSETELLYSKTYGDMRVHLGLDIAADAGAAVKASGDGTVKDIIKDPLLGTTVIIDHGNNITGLYSGLNESISVKKGQNVKAGDNIGAVGTVPSESSDVSHLHFAFKENDKFISPLSLINLGS